MTTINDPNRLVHFGLLFKSYCPDRIHSRSISLISETLVAMSQDPNKITFDYLEESFKEIEVFENLHLVETYVAVRLLRVLSFIVRPVLSRLTNWGCRNGHRYKASTIQSLESNSTDFTNPSSFFPIASRARDIGISRSRCPEDTLVSFMSISRSVIQLIGNDRTLIKEVETRLISIGLVRILSVGQPVLELLDSSLQVTHNQVEGNLVYVFPAIRRSCSSSHDSVVPGFDCNEKRECEVNSVIDHFLNFNKTNNLDKELRNDFMFLQSVNSNWFPHLRSEWGIKLLESLISLWNRQPKRTSSNTQCASFDFAQQYLADPNNFPIGQVVVEGISQLSSVHPTCTVLIATAFSLIQEGVTRAILENSRNDEKFILHLFTHDLGMLMEMAWQTIAGDRFSELLADETPLFELMNVTWNRFHV